MDSNNLTVLDLFVLAKAGGPNACLYVQELEFKASETLELLYPGFQKLSCREVLDSLDAQRRHADTDLAVLCYEALGFLDKSRTRGES